MYFRQRVIGLGIIISIAGCCWAGQDDIQPSTTANNNPHASTATNIPLVNNFFMDTDIRQALQAVSAEVGVTIIPDESVGGPVSCTLEDVPLDKALDIMLAGTPFIVQKTPDYYLVCSRDPMGVSFPAISHTSYIKLDHITPTRAIKLLSPAFTEYVQGDDESGMLVITAIPAIMYRIVSDVKLFDMPPPHVLLNARMVIMEQSDLKDIGVKWDWPKIAAGINSDSSQHGGQAMGTSWPWGIQIGYAPNKEFTNSLMLSLNLLTQNEEATVVASPQIMAQHGKQAEIKVLTEEYFQIESEGLYARSQLEKIESGTILKITPQIAANGSITLDVNTEVSDVIARGEDGLPVVTRRTTSNVLRIQDGGTAVIAGLKDNRTRQSKEKAPGLSRLPIFGGLFRNKNGSNTSRQVAVFVTAQIVSDLEMSQYATEEPEPIPKPVGNEFKQALREAITDLDQDSDTKQTQKL